MEAIEPISVRMVSAILFSMLEVQFRKLAMRLFHITLFAIFSQICHHVADPKL